MRPLNNRTRAWWARSPNPGNFGDMITPFLVEAITGKPAIYSKPSHGALMGAGSTIRLAGPGCVIWGSGIMHYNDKIRDDLRILAVRGPVTGAQLEDQDPQIYGDPALLLPRVYDNNQPKRDEIGIVPHYVHLEEAKRIFNKNPLIKVISPLTADPRPVIDLIRSCGLIASSSLHGLIAAEAYGIPYAWITFPDAKRQLNTDGAKFADFYRSMNQDIYSTTPIYESIDLWKARFTAPFSSPSDWDLLWQACPLRSLSDATDDSIPHTTDPK